MFSPPKPWGTNGAGPSSISTSLTQLPTLSSPSSSSQSQIPERPASFGSFALPSTSLVVAEPYLSSYGGFLTHELEPQDMAVLDRTAVSELTGAVWDHIAEWALTAGWDPMGVLIWRDWSVWNGFIRWDEPIHWYGSVQ